MAFQHDLRFSEIKEGSDVPVKDIKSCLVPIEQVERRSMLYASISSECFSALAVNLLSMLLCTADQSGKMLVITRNLYKPSL